MDVIDQLTSSSSTPEQPASSHSHPPLSTSAILDTLPGTTLEPPPNLARDNQQGYSIPDPELQPSSEPDSQGMKLQSPLVTTTPVTHTKTECESGAGITAVVATLKTEVAPAPVQAAAADVSNQNPADPVPVVDVPEAEVPESKLETDNGGSDASTAGMVPQTPQISLTFLLASGRRRTMLFEPETTIARVKELVWNAWPGEWQDEHPPTPSYLRVLYLGKILQDDDTLITLAFPTHIPLPASTRTPPSSTIVHLAIRPYAPQTEDDAPKKKGRRRRGRGSNGEDGAGVDDDGITGRGSGCCSSCVVC